jgi:hypothetical protein
MCCFSRKHIVVFTNTTYDEILNSLESYLNAEYGSTFKIIMSTSDKHLKHYFIAEDRRSTRKLIIYYKLKRITTDSKQTSEDYISRLSLLNTKNMMSKEFYRLTINTNKIVHRVSI